MITYYVNVLNNANPLDFQFQTVATLSQGAKIKNGGTVYSITSVPIFGGGNQAWIDVLPA